MLLAQIHDVLFARVFALKNTTTASLVFGDVVESRPVGAIGEFSPRHGSVLVEAGEVERVEELDYAGNPPGIAWRQIFNIRVYVRDENDSTAWQMLSSLYLAQIDKAIKAPSAWWTMGGYAVDAETLPWTHQPPDGGLGGATLPIAVTYRVSELDMAVQR